MTTEITRNAYAKINLTLDVGAKRPDGYHEIRSIMQTIRLHDTLTVRVMPERPKVFLEVFGEEAKGVPIDESNLVYQAAVCLQKIAATRSLFQKGQFGLHIRLEKCIPSQAGLGGGSSDAAAALQLIDKLFALNLTKAELQQIGTTLGADVPFFLAGGTALVEGLGERITPLPPITPPWDLIVVKPPVGISTAAAYAALDTQQDRILSHATAQWLSGLQTVHNNFMPVALSVPEIAAVVQVLRDKSPMLCGSGSALFCRTPIGEGQEILSHIQRERLGKAWLTSMIGTESE